MGTTTSTIGTAGMVGAGATEASTAAEIAGGIAAFGEFLLAGAAFVGGAALFSSSARGKSKEGQVKGRPDLSYSYNRDELSATISRTGAKWGAPAIAAFRLEGDQLKDEGQQAGQIDGDGGVSLDPAWMQAHGLQAGATAMTDGSARPAAQSQTQARTDADTDTDRACRATTDASAGEDDAAGQIGSRPGLPPSLQSTFQSARLSAYISDPKLAEAGLNAFGATSTPAGCAEWQAHHLFSIAQVRGNQDLFSAAAKAGWRTDEPQNVIGLPHDKLAQNMLAAVGSNRPVHDNPHQGAYKNEVVRAVDRVRSALSKSSFSEGSDDYNRLARSLLEQEQVGLKSKVMSKGLGRLTMAEPPSAEQPA